MRYLLNFKLFERRGTFTKEEVEEIAKKYKYKNDFKKNDESAYQAARKKFQREEPGFFDRITSHMDRQKKYPFTKEEIEEIAKKYNNKKDFAKNDETAYQAARKKFKEEDPGFYDRITSHMDKFKYSKEDLEEIAKKYKTKNDFRKNDSGAYNAALNFIKEDPGFYDRITSHMEKQIRDKFTKEELEEIAKKYKTKNDFKKNDESAYQAARTRKKFQREDPGFYDRITSHMDVLQRKPFTKEEVEEIAKKYNNKNDFKKNDSSVYFKALKFDKEEPGFYDRITSHMRKKWNDIDIEAEAKRWNNMIDFMNHSPNAYQYLLKHPQLFSKLTAHMDRKLENWDEEKIWNIAKNYFIRKKFREQAPNAYAALCRLNKTKPGILAKMQAHMDPPITDAEMREKAAKYDKMSDFMIHETEAYYQLIENPALFHKYCSHMNDYIMPFEM